MLLIKGGQNGSIYGHENKYLKIAEQINNKYGISVVVSSNPYDRTDSLEQAIQIIHEECSPVSDIYYMGHSNGAILGARFAHNHQEIKKMLLINGPLMINWLQTKQGIAKFKGESVTFVYGKKDPSYQYCELLHSINSIAVVNLATINDADHNFNDKLDEFCNLSEKYLLGLKGLV